MKKKINSVEGKFKTSKKITDFEYQNFLKLGMYDEIYGNCYPNIYVEYIREYFSLLNARITLDRSINYISFSSNKSIKKVDKIVLEYKTKDFNDIDLFNGKIPFQFSRMSKYCEGFNELFNPKHLQREAKY